jgi:septum formation protein
MRLILASGSARRPELLAALGFQFEVVPANVDESSHERDPVALTRELALRKARAGALAAPDAVVIGADTLVVLDGRLLGKPANADEARATLEALRGLTHQVVSGVAVVAPILADSEPAAPSGHPEPVEGRPTGREAAAVVTTHVTMRPYTDDEIAAYVASGDPLDKSGAYAIQHPTFAPAAHVNGCLCSVIGLPLWTLRDLLRDVAHVETQLPAFERCAGCPYRDGEDPIRSS